MRQVLRTGVVKNYWPRTTARNTNIVSVGATVRLRAGRRRNCASTSGEGREVSFEECRPLGCYAVWLSNLTDIYFLHYVQTASGFHPASYTLYVRDFSRGQNRQSVVATPIRSHLHSPIHMGLETLI
jgi:hypothetical protein